MKTIPAQFDPIHIKIIDSLIPFYGKSREEVVKNIAMRWMEENIGTEKIKRLAKIGVINSRKASKK